MKRTFQARYVCPKTIKLLDIHNKMVDYCCASMFLHRIIRKTANSRNFKSLSLQYLIDRVFKVKKQGKGFL